MTDSFKGLIAEAKRQNRYKPTIAERVIAFAKYPPFVLIWRARVAWLLQTKWNAPKGHEARCSLIQNWQYSKSMTEYMDDGPLFPSEAIEIDREYWEQG